MTIANDQAKLDRLRKLNRSGRELEARRHKNEHYSAIERALGREREAVHARERAGRRKREGKR